jgi:hypothetical protein
MIQVLRLSDQINPSSIFLLALHKGGTPTMRVFFLISVAPFS